MPVEIEAKMKVTDLTVVRERLTAAEGKRVGAYLERNTFFDRDDRSLLAADQGLRVRLTTDTVSGAKVCTVTHKGPRRHGPLKSREETELVADSDVTAIALMGHLGFARVLGFEKRRESWTLGGCKVELDEIPHLGTFVEVEGPSEGAVMKVRDELKLTDRPIVRASYIAMLITHLQEQGEGLRDVTFAEPAGARPTR